MNPNPKRGLLADILVFLALLAIPSAVLWRALAEGAIPLFMDPMLYFFPLRMQAARIIAQGEWPLWNRCLMGGMPLLSNPQAAVVYPFNWPSLFSPGGFWFTFPQVFQLGLYGALTSWALRRMGAGRWSAAWAGGLAIAGDYGWSRLQFGNYLNILPWWPLWIGAAEFFLNSKSEIRNSKTIRNSNEGNEESSKADKTSGRLLKKSRRDECFQPATIVAGLKPNEFASPGGTTAALGSAKDVYQPPASSDPEDFENDGIEIGETTLARRGIFAPLMLGSIAVAMPVLGGAHQPALYGLAALGLYSAVLVLIDNGNRLRRLGFLILTFLIGGLLAAPGWLPQIDFLRETSRAEALTTEQALEGSIGSPRELAVSLVGDWDSAFQPRQQNVPPRYADAESQAAIGALALLLALIPPAAGSRRRIWVALLVAALATMSLSLRPVAATLFQAIPQSGLFHDPRRWLGISQWLFLMAAGLGADRLASILRGRVALAVIAAALSAATAFQGWFTRRTTEWRTIPAGELINPGSGALIAKAGLHPGERFFSLDWERQSSYEYRRPDLTDWALPNLGMLWGYEDLGGYEPGQSLRWRKFMENLVAEPWRRIWTQHFSLATDPWRSDLLNQANVRAAIFPRFGVPLYFRPQQQPMVWGSMMPQLEPGKLSVLALLLRADGADIALRPAIDKQAELLSPPHPISLRDDLIFGGTTTTLPRAEPFGQDWIEGANTTLPFASSLWTISQPWKLELRGAVQPDARLIDLFAWTDQIAKLWQPLEIRTIAALMRYRGAPSRTQFVSGQGQVVSEKIRNNSLELEIETTSPQAAVMISDAYWPGWEARLADGSPLQIVPAGPWRGIVLPQGRSIVRMEYHPDGLKLAIELMWGGVVLLLIAGLLAARRSVLDSKEPSAPSESLPSAP